MIRVILALIALCSVSVTAAANYTDKVLVIVNEDIITQSEFDFRMNTVVQEIRSSGKTELPKGISGQLLENMVAEKLQLQEAERRGLNVVTEEINLAIERFAKQQNQSVAQLKQSLAREGRSFASFQLSVYQALMLSRLNDYYVQTRVLVPEYEIDGYLAQNNIDANSSEYHIAHILLKNTEENNAVAHKAVSELKQGMVFAEAALIYSEGTDAQQGGVIGWRQLSQLPEVYAEIIKQMQVGEISDVLQSDSGLHIVKLLDARGGERAEITQSEVKHILISAKTDIAKAHASKRLTEIKQRIDNGEDFSKLARTLSDDSVSAANGGSLGWVSPGEMVPTFEQAYQRLNVGEVSEPVLTQYGVHLVKVIDRRVKNVSDQLLRARATNILRRQRAEREFSQWVRELREQAYIEYLTS